jgi:Sulfotransferase domain
MMASTMRVAARRAAKRASRAAAMPMLALRGLPDFLIIGTQRGGTTSLYRYLQQHPAVLPAVLNKGIHYFDTNHDKGPSWYRSHFPTSVSKAVRRRGSGADRILTGEGSPYYAFHPLAPARIAELLPNVRSIIMLRDPIARAHSHYQHEVARGFEDLSFEDALIAEEGRLAGEEARIVSDPRYYSFAHQHHSYIARGMYLEQIERWHTLFPRDQLLIIESGGFFADADASYREVLRFLDLPERSLPAYEKMNAHSYDRMSPRALALLRERYEEPNRRLAEHLGRELPWDAEAG